jgi:hypothetical protein
MGIEIYAVHHKSATLGGLIFHKEFASQRAIGQTPNDGRSAATKLPRQRSEKPAFQARW